MAKKNDPNESYIYRELKRLKTKIETNDGLLKEMYKDVSEIFDRLRILEDGNDLVDFIDIELPDDDYEEEIDGE